MQIRPPRTRNNKMIVFFHPGIPKLKFDDEDDGEEEYD